MLRRAVQESPADPNIVMNLGLELARSGDLHAGLERYREAFRLLSHQPQAQVVPEFRETLLTQFATRLCEARAYQEAVAVLTSPLAQNGGLTASLHFALGLALSELKDFEAAAEQIRHCIAKRNHPSLAPIIREIRKAGPHHCLALCLSQLGQAEPAQKAFDQALREDPQSRPVRLHYAEFLAANGKPVEALNLFHALAAEKPDDPQAWRQGGGLAVSRPEFLEVALDWTAAALSHSPDDPPLLQQRAEALTLAGQCAAALPLWRSLQTSSDSRGLAAFILCALADDDTLPPVPGHLESQASQYFLNWYRRLLQFNARETVDRLNNRLDTLSALLPSAAGILSTAVAEAAA